MSGGLIISESEKIIVRTAIRAFMYTLALLKGYSAFLVSKNDAMFFTRLCRKESYLFPYLNLLTRHGIASCNFHSYDIFSSE